MQTRYGDYLIRYDPVPFCTGYDWEVVHRDFDGAPDSDDHRYGRAPKLENAIDLIDELEAE